MSVRRAAVWSLTFPFPPPCPLASFVYLALATLTSLSKGASKGIAPFSPALLTPFGTEPEARSRWEEGRGRTPRDRHPTNRAETGDRRPFTHSSPYRWLGSSITHKPSISLVSHITYSTLFLPSLPPHFTSLGLSSLIRLVRWEERTDGGGEWRITGRDEWGTKGMRREHQRPTSDDSDSRAYGSLSLPSSTLTLLTPRYPSHSLRRSGFAGETGPEGREKVWDERNVTRCEPTIRRSGGNSETRLSSPTSLMLGPSFLGSSVRRQFPTVSSSSHYDPRNEGPKGVRNRGKDGEQPTFSITSGLSHGFRLSDVPREWVRECRSTLDLSCHIRSVFLGHAYAVSSSHSTPSPRAAEGTGPDPLR